MREVTCMKRLTIGLHQTLRHLKGAETWFQHPTILLRVIPQSALRRLLPKEPVEQGFVWLINSEPGSGPNKLTNSFVPRTGICIDMFDVVSLESN